jgi:N-acetyl-anhydromuramyl-L-alanine amidase AmpD
VNDWNNDTRGTIGTQFVIGGRNCQTLLDKYDGEIVQTMDYKNYAWHLGIGNTPMHRNSVGIEICNFGPLTKVGNDYFSWANKRVVASEIVQLKQDFRGYKAFHKITNDQLHALNFLIAKIAKDTGIDATKGLKERLKKMDPYKAFDFDQNIKDGNIKGLFCHTNVSPKNRYGNFEKWDWNPQPELCDLINSL